MMINLYAILLVTVTLATVLSRRTMYAILYLILLFVLVAFVVMSFKIDFIGLIFIIVYVGAIATLFLFIVMMLGGEDWVSDPALDLDNYNLLVGSGFSSHWILNWINKGFWYLKHAALDLIIALIMGVFLIELFSSELFGNLDAWLNVSQMPYISGMFNTAYLYGVFFYNYWYIPFILAGIVLLIAMLGSIILTTSLFLVDNKQSNKDSFNQLFAANSSKNEPGMIDQILNKQKRQERADFKSIPFHLMWFVTTFVTAFFIKDYFMVTPTARLIFIAVFICIFLSGSIYISYRAKRHIK